MTTKKRKASQAIGQIEGLAELIVFYCEHATKTIMRIIDFVDAGRAVPLRMRDKRQRGYRAMGYRIRGGLSSIHNS